MLILDVLGQDRFVTEAKLLKQIDGRMLIDRHLYQHFLGDEHTETTAPKGWINDQAHFSYVAPPAVKLMIEFAVGNDTPLVPCEEMPALFAFDALHPACHGRRLGHVLAQIEEIF